MKRNAVIILLAAALAVLPACSSASNATAQADAYPTAEAWVEEAVYDTWDDMDVAVVEASSPSTGGGGGGLDAGGSLQRAATQEQKIVTTVWIYMESRDYDASVREIYNAMNAVGGRVEYSEMVGNLPSGDEEEILPLTSRDRRWINMRIRVPQEILDTFVTRLEEVGNVLSRQESAEDITLNYVDTEARISSLETRQSRILAMVENAETVEELLALEEHLGNIRYELEHYQRLMNLYNDQVSYATVHVNLEEVQIYTEWEEGPAPDAPIMQRISWGLRNNMKNLGESLVNLFVWCMVNIVYLAVLAVMVLVAYRQLRRRWPGAKHPQPSPRKNGEEEEVSPEEKQE